MSQRVIKFPKRKQRGKSSTATGPRADLVQEKIREAIHSGKFQPGERIRETEVAQWLNVSRTPVREALRRLESEGIVTFASWRGVVVAELDRQQIAELYAMRQILEGAAARLAAQHISATELDLLKRLQSQATNKSLTLEALAKLNRKFHEVIYVSTHNRYLLQMLNSLRSALALLQGTTYSLKGRTETAASEHRAIVEAIEARNPDAAEAAARTHIEYAERARFQMLFDLDEAE
jgi:DNA-binding GntR family transcriptional regulator